MCIEYLNVPGMGLNALQPVSHLASKSSCKVYPILQMKTSELREAR